jgi:hypothetical protein
LIDIGAHISETVTLTPWVLSVVVRTTSRVRGTNDANRLKALSRLAQQLADNGTGGTVTYVDRHGAQWAVTVSASLENTAS